MNNLVVYHNRLEVPELVEALTVLAFSSEEKDSFNGWFQWFIQLRPVLCFTGGGYPSL